MHTVLLDPHNLPRSPRRRRPVIQCLLRLVGLGSSVFAKTVRVLSGNKTFRVLFVTKTFELGTSSLKSFLIQGSQCLLRLSGSFGLLL